MKNNKLYKLYLTDSVRKDVFVGSWVVRKCAGDEARNYLKLYAHSMRIEEVNPVTMNIMCEYELTRREV